MVDIIVGWIGFRRIHPRESPARREVQAIGAILGLL